MSTLITIIHVFACMVLIGVVLLQQGKGGGMGAAFGGATTQVFGGRGAGNILTRATAICATIFMLTSIKLAHDSSSHDSSIEARAKEQAAKKKSKGELKEKEKPKDAAPAPTPAAPAPEKAPETPAPAPSP
jgi:preprotein translocase subunit SecG